MKTIITFLFLMAGVQINAEEMHYPLEGMVEKSNLIIVATLEDYKKLVKNNTDYEQGKLKVKSLLKGSTKLNTKINISWSNPSSVLCPRIGFYNTLNKKYIWLLKVRKDGSVDLYTSQQCRNIGELKEIQKLIKAKTPAKKVK
jgi:hypothetical protein